VDFELEYTRVDGNAVDDSSRESTPPPTIFVMGSTVHLNPNMFCIQHTELLSMHAVCINNIVKLSGHSNPSDN